MSMTRRAFFIQHMATAGALSALALVNKAQAQTVVSEDDPQAMALGYKAANSQVDTKKHANFAKDQQCSGCVLYQGKPQDATGGCAVFANKHVSGNGWCGAWTKKA